MFDFKAEFPLTLFSSEIEPNFFKTSGSATGFFGVRNSTNFLLFSAESLKVFAGNYF